MLAGFAPKASAAATGAGTQNSSATQQAISSVEAATTLNGLQAAVQSFMDQYGLTISFACPSQAQVNGDVCSDVASNQFTQTQTTSREVIEELSKLDPVITQDFTIHNFYVVGDFQLNMGGSAGTKVVAGVFDSSFGGPLVKAATNRATILHEFYHYLEYEVYGSNGPSDPSWTANNPGDFSYVGGSCVDGEAGCQAGTHPINGFVTGYAETNIIEDKAETFSYLMESKNYKNLSSWAATDTLLAGKVSVMKAFLAGLDPAMDNSYYADIHAFAAENYSYDGFVNGYQLVSGDKSAVDFDTSDGDMLVVDGQAHSVTVEPGGTLKGSGTILTNLSVNVDGTVAPGHSPGCLTVADLYLSGTYEAEIGGNTACDSYDQIKATGSVTLTTSRLDETTNGILNAKLYGGFVPAVGNTFIIIDNQSANPVTGQFDGIAEGGTYVSQGVTYRVSYQGGDGNDVTLTVIAVDQAVAAAASVPAPGVPNTGFAAFRASTVLTLLGSTLCAAVIAALARRIKSTAV